MAETNKEKPPLGDPVLFGPNGEKTTDGLENSQLWHKWGQEKQAEIDKLKERLGDDETKSIFVTRGAYTWGKGERAMKSFINCFKNGSTLREFKIIKLPEGAKDFQIDGMGSVMWSGNAAEAERVPFDAEFLDDVRYELTERLGLCAELANLLHARSTSDFSDFAHDLEEITERLYDLQVTEIKDVE